MNYLFIFAAMLFNVIAHLSAKSLAGSSFLSFRTLINPYLWAMLAGFGISIIFWLLALKDVPLSIAHPIFASGILLVQIGSYFFLGEKLDPLRIFLLTLGYASIATATYLALKN